MRARRATAMAGLLAAAALTACDGTASSAGPPGRSPTGPATPSKTSSAPETTSASPTATVVPAGGKSIEFTNFAITMPAGWKVLRFDTLGGGASEQDTVTGGEIVVHSFPRIGHDTLDSFVRPYLKRRNQDGNHLQRLDDRVVDGVEGYVLQGTDTADNFAYEYGTLYGDQEVHIEFYYRLKNDPSADPFAIIEPVLAALDWK